MATVKSNRAQTASEQQPGKQTASEQQPAKVTERPAFIGVASACVSAMVTFGLAWFAAYCEGPTYSQKLMGSFVGMDSSNRPVVLYVPERRGERLLFVVGNEAFHCESAGIISVNNGSSLTARLTCAATGDPHGGVLTFGEGNALRTQFRDRFGDTSNALLEHSR